MRVRIPYTAPAGMIVLKLPAPLTCYPPYLGVGRFWVIRQKQNPNYFFIKVFYMRKKSSASQISQLPQLPTDLLTCTVCGKEFKKNDYTKYIINGGYTCSWKCFIDEGKRKDAEREKNIASKGNKRSKK